MKLKDILDTINRNDPTELIELGWIESWKDGKPISCSKCHITKIEMTDYYYIFSKRNRNKFIRKEFNDILRNLYECKLDLNNSEYGDYVYAYDRKFTKEFHDLFNKCMVDEFKWIYSFGDAVVDVMVDTYIKYKSKFDYINFREFMEKYDIDKLNKLSIDLKLFNESDLPELTSLPPELYKTLREDLGQILNYRSKYPDVSLTNIIIIMNEVKKEVI